MYIYKLEDKNFSNFNYTDYRVPKNEKNSISLKTKIK
jgi:hypothetical protein